ncbi:MAG: DUF459 domain-containing protein [Deltaproteobacteria bacterium]|jgi:S-formylglutathione hydrolase FrmB|nr:DUF459 domain-containing protein [Deltaproteobacteria bacterium]
MLARRKGFSPKKVLVAYFLALALVLIHESDRVASWLEDLARKGDGRPSIVALDLAARMQALSSFKPLAALKDKESRLVEYLTPRGLLGSVGEAPKPQSAPRAERVIRRSLTDVAPYVAPPTAPSASIAPISIQPATSKDDSELKSLITLGEVQTPTPRNPLAPEASLISEVQGNSLLRVRRTLMVTDAFYKETFEDLLESPIFDGSESRAELFSRDDFGLAGKQIPYQKELEGKIESFKPELAIVSIGSLDTKDLERGTGSAAKILSDSWNEEYKSRVSRFLETFQRHNVNVLWVGFPVMGREPYHSRIMSLNAAVDSSCKELPNCLFLDTLDKLSGPDGKFTQALKTPEGTEFYPRREDLIHLNSLGSKYMATYIVERLDAIALFGLSPPKITLEAKVDEFEQSPELLETKPFTLYGLPPETVSFKNILLIGDSSMVEGFGPVMEKTLKEYPELIVKRKFKSATGLVRSDFFDWGKYFGDALTESSPDLVILSLGANDTQDIVTSDRKRYFVGDQGWNAEYKARISSILDQADAIGAKVLWVGLPIMGKATYNTNIQILNSVAQDACLSKDFCEYFDSYPVLADENGEYMAFVKDESGKHERIRAKDSIHLTERGGELLVDALFQLPGGIGIFGLPVAPLTKEYLAFKNARYAPASDALAPSEVAAASGGESPEATLAEVERPEPRTLTASSLTEPAQAAPVILSPALMGNPLAAAALLPGAPSGPLAPSAGQAEDASVRTEPPRGYQDPGGEPILPNNTATLMEVLLPSKALGRETSYFIYLTNPESLAPTVFLLHGAEGDRGVWQDKMGKDLLDLADDLGVNLVMPDGGAFGWYLDSPLKSRSRYEDYVINELIPDILVRFKADPQRLGIMGISMGGHGALTLALKHPGLFKSVGSLSGVTDIASHGQKTSLDKYLRLEELLGPYEASMGLWQGNSAYHLTRRNPDKLKATNLSLSVGLADKLVLAENRQYSRLLTDLGIAHDYQELSGGHSWDLWQKTLPKHLTDMANTL